MYSPDTPPYPKKEHVILGLGEGAVGKTTLVYTAAFKRFHPGIGFTCGFNSISFDVDLLGDYHRVLVWEFGGQQQFGPWLIKTTPAINHADAFLLFFDISFAETLYSLDEYISFIRKRGSTAPLVLVATKSDLEWNIDPSEIELFMMERGINHAVITSSYAMHNCMEPFRIAIAAAEKLDYISRLAIAGNDPSVISVVNKR
ncbi:MAG: Rab family GTPase [Candidatus Hodarchaeales archaeon]